MNKFCGAVLLSVLLIITVPLSLDTDESIPHQMNISRVPHFFVEGDTTPREIFDLFSTTLRTRIDPAFVDVGDFNNDSLKDIAVGSRVNKTVELFFQKTDGTFETAPSKTIYLDSPPTGMAVGDLDGDATDDIIVTSAATQKAYLLYQKSGFSVSSKDARPDPYGVVIGDFDQDGRNDFAYVSYNATGFPNCTFTVHLKRTNFYPENYVSLTGHGLFRATLIGIADIDRDGHPDLAIGDGHFSKIAIYRGNVENNVLTWSLIQIMDSSSVNNPMEMYFVQVDMFGSEELVVLSKGNNKITIFDYKNTSGQFSEFITKEGLTDPATSTMLEVNNDLIPDLITVSRNTCIAEIFLTRLTLPYGNPDFSFPSSGFPLKAISEDINNDGLADLLISTNATSLNGSVTIYYRLKSGFLSNANENVFFEAGSLPASIVQGDFDGDGIIELGAICSGNTLRFQKINQSESKSKITGISPFEAKTADLTGDAIPDIVVSNSGSNNITFYFGGGTFFQDQGISLSLQISGLFNSPKGIAIDDIDGDGRFDVIVACSGGIQIFFNTGDPPYFNESRSFNLSLPMSNFTYLNTGNFNVGYEVNMGWPARKDIAVYNSSSHKLEIYFQHYPSRSFSIIPRAEFFPENPSLPVLPVLVGTGKINNDSMDDLAIPLTNGRLVVYIQKAGLQNGFSEGPGSKFSTILQNGISNASIGDLNDDGRDEVAIMSNRIGSAHIIKFDGSDFSNLRSFSGGAGLGGLLVADVNGDLRQDLLISSPLSSSISINYQNNLPPRALATCVTNPPYYEGIEMKFDGRNSTDSYSDVSSLNYTWSFGDGQIAYGNIITHVFIKNGTYIVSLRVTDRGGVSGYNNLSIDVNDLAPAASFGISTQTVREGSPIDFTDTSTSYPDPIISRRWEFGDGTIDYGNNSSVRHTYMKNGEYQVNLTVTDSDGSTGSYSRTITVLDGVPSALFAVSNAFPIENTAVYFTDESTSYPDPIVAWSWDFGDGGNSHEKNPSHVYVQNGTYTVQLTIWDSDGSTNSSSMIIRVQDSVPSVSFTFSPIIPYEGQIITFEDNSTAYDGILSWSWDFGDGTYSDERNPSHYYMNNGTFSVKLTVIDRDGSVSSFDKQISVKDTSPIIVDMKAWSSSGQLVEDAEIEMEVMIIPGWESVKTLRYLWDYNYSGSFNTCEITQINKTTHSFSKQGIYRIVVRVWDSDSYVEDSFVIKIDNVKPVAKFSYKLVEGGEIRFDASLSEDTESDLDTLEYQWNFNDGTGWSTWSRDPIIIHMFENDGNYSVYLRVRDDDGAANITSAWVIVDRTVPRIGNIIVGEAVVGNPITITAAVEDNIGLKNVTLFYEIGNETFSMPMLKQGGSNSIWIGQIRAINTTGIIVYWIEAVDTSGNKFSTGKLEFFVSEKSILNSFWIFGLGIAGLVLGGFYVYLRQFSTAVDEVFVIYEDGCLMAHDTRRLKPGMDDDVLSSMLIAIQDFVKTAFKDEDTTALKRLDFGEKKILVEKGEKIYLVAVLHGKYDTRIAQKMPKILSEIQRDYGNVFLKWDGDLEKVRGIRNKIHLLFRRDWKDSIEALKSIGKRLSLKKSMKIECPVCNKEISSKDSRCPSCGAELNFSDVSELENLAKEIFDGHEKAPRENKNSEENTKHNENPDEPGS